MKIVYLCNLRDDKFPDKDILFSLKKKGEVKIHDSRQMDMKKIGKDVSECDLFLFHGEVGSYDIPTQFLVLERLKLILQMCCGKKVLWFFDKIWGNKINILTELYNDVDLIFVNDETWLKRFKSDKIFPLHHASSEKHIGGKFIEEISCDIALIGDIYGERKREYDFLRDTFGGRLKVFNGKFGKDFANTCKSARAIVLYNFPFDDYYWSDMIYRVMSCGGVVINQRTQGLKDEGFEDGKHYFDYNKDQELVALLKSLLDKKSNSFRKHIAKTGKKFVGKITYSNRIDEILKHCENTNISVSN